MHCIRIKKQLSLPTAQLDKTWKNLLARIATLRLEMAERADWIPTIECAVEPMSAEASAAASLGNLACIIRMILMLLRMEYLW